MLVDAATSGAETRGGGEVLYVDMHCFNQAFWGSRPFTRRLSGDMPVAKIIEGDRIGKLGTLALGCSATIFDSTRLKVLLTRRTDNGRWCLPGGRTESGESITETCLRETLEETGLQVRIVRLLGVYSSPHRLVEYPDGNRYQIVALNFEAEPIGGALTISDETTDYGYFSWDEITRMDVMETHVERLTDVFSGQPAPFVR
jgi:ADP-ribose pyrophosphatase YjhB (NUDIX family)